MNKTTSALAIKFILIFGASWVSFSLFGGNTFTFLLILSVAGTLLNYYVGDRLILPRYGNIFATITDGGLSIITAAVLSGFIYDYSATTASFLTFGIIIMVGEFFFHRYLLRYSIVESGIVTGMSNSNDLNLDMEAGVEIDFYEDEIDKNDINDDF